jgi:hypothetical protein
MNRDVSSTSRRMRVLVGVSGSVATIKVLPPSSVPRGRECC